jgi:hypothetical protein
MENSFQKKFGWLGWIFLGLAPSPIGLLIGPVNIFESYQHGKILFVFYVILNLACGCGCGIGQSGGFKSKKAGDIVRGVFAGIVIGAFNAIIVFFAGCCSELNRIH